MTVLLTVIQGRDALTIAQLPTTANGETLILDFNDDALGGAAYYQAELTITTDVTVAEPGSLVLFGVALCFAWFVSLRGRARRRFLSTPGARFVPLRTQGASRANVSY